MKNDVPLTLDVLRDQLFAQLEAIRAKTPAPEVLLQSRAVCDIAGRIIDTARCEIDYTKLVNTSRGGKALEAEKPALPEIRSDRIVTKTASGMLEVVPVRGGSLMTHKMK